MRVFGVVLALVFYPVLASGDDVKPLVPATATKAVNEKPSALAKAVVVMPYVQPGAGAAHGGFESKRILWFTEQTPGERGCLGPGKRRHRAPADAPDGLCGTRGP